MKTQTKLSTTKQAEAENHLYQAISLLKNAEEAKMFFEDLCTPAEKEAMTDRWQVVKHIKNEKPYRKIQEETGVSVTTVGRVARTISLGTGGYNLLFNRYIEKEKRRKNERRKKS